MTDRSEFQSVAATPAASQFLAARNRNARYNRARDLFLAGNTILYLSVVRTDKLSGTMVKLTRRESQPSHPRMNRSSGTSKNE
jgi:hypothetical protein